MAVWVMWQGMGGAGRKEEKSRKTKHKGGACCKSTAMLFEGYGGQIVQ
ncbi:hypothetical protein C370_07344 [Cryptococcus neoformans A1-35-8]|nr:hypothetical protein C369_07270 [Cryptococcus neoformans var. grubii A5-35-17]OXH00246.1 hypothetical protein C370_07344 [Cryptococcus neoformans var. grubii A1-35-8]